MTLLVCISGIDGSRSSISLAAPSRWSEAKGACVIVFNGEIYNHLELRATPGGAWLPIPESSFRH